MAKCLKISKRALLFSYERDYVCRGKKCQCYCYKNLGDNGGCKTVVKTTYNLYKIGYKVVQSVQKDDANG